MYFKISDFRTVLQSIWDRNLYIQVSSYRCKTCGNVHFDKFQEKMAKKKNNDLYEKASQWNAASTCKSKRAT